ncbi:MAG: lipopolysaccharide biosynthesis protein [Dictyoglomus sp. NZ13-RE01]|nr:MAG: lipopolysaccharide biosynthesis protein [Dictyoglomus sp. NZ13-RE01]
MKKLEILGIPFIFFDDELEFENLILSFLSSKKLNLIFTPNAEIISIAHKDGKLKEILKYADLNLPDGDGVLLLAKKDKRVSLKKFAGIDAMVKILEIAEKKKKKVYFLGAKDEVLRDMINKLRKKFPGLDIAGWHHGYFSNNEIERIISDIDCDILFVALGAPKQEFFIYNNKDKIKAKIAMGVGGSFDVLSERKKRAPNFFIRLHLEWLYRMLQEPKRFIKRAPNLFYFFYLFIRSRLCLRN